MDDRMQDIGDAKPRMSKRRRFIVVGRWALAAAWAAVVYFGPAVSAPSAVAYFVEFAVLGFLLANALWQHMGLLTACAAAVLITCMLGIADGAVSLMVPDHPFSSRSPRPGAGHPHGKRGGARRALSGGNAGWAGGAASTRDAGRPAMPRPRACPREERRARRRAHSRWSGGRRRRGGVHAPRRARGAGDGAPSVNANRERRIFAPKTRFVRWGVFLERRYA